MHEININEIIEEISELNGKDEGDLYAILGYQSLGLEGKASELKFTNSFYLTKSELITDGKVYFEKYKQQLKEQICDKGEYCKKKKEYSDDFSLLSGALVPIIVAGINLPVSLVTVLCVLAFKYGLNKLCGCKA